MSYGLQEESDCIDRCFIYLVIQYAYYWFLLRKNSSFFYTDTQQKRSAGSLNPDIQEVDFSPVFILHQSHFDAIGSE